MIPFTVRIPLDVASSIRADAPTQLVGLAIRPNEWPELIRLANRHGIIMSPFMMFRKVEWRIAFGKGRQAIVHVELVGIDCHKYYPLAREILMPNAKTIKMAKDAHVATLLNPAHTHGGLRIHRAGNGV